MSLVLGVGLSSDADPVELRQLAVAVLIGNGCHPDDVIAVATLDTKTQTPAVLELANTVAAAVTGYQVATLALQEVPHPSRVVGLAVGTPSVAEAAVITYGARLIVSKTARGRCTIAIGLCEHPGHEHPLRSEGR